MKENKAKKIILVLLAVVCVAVLFYSLYRGLLIYIPQTQEQHRFNELQQIVEQKNKEEKSHTQNATEDRRRTGDGGEEESSGEGGENEKRGEYAGEDNFFKYEEIETINSDFRGWLRIEDTIIDYPVVKPPESDPEYYLHRDFDRNYSFSGTPFIGEGADENSDAFVIYAHKMKNDTMFGTLDNYADTEWARQHPYIEFDTPEGHRVYRVFASFRTKVGGENEFQYYRKTVSLSEKEYNAFVKELGDISIIDTNDRPTEKKQLLLLSTCSYHTENGRFVVAAYRM